MPVKKSALPARELGQLREAILDITAVVNSPRPDAALIAAAGVELDRALFPLLARIARHGALGVKELADFVGRDYTTVSRQVAKLATLGLVERRPAPTDARMRVATITAQGKAMTDAVDAAREARARQLFKSWSTEDFDAMVRLVRRLAAAIAAGDAGGAP